MNMTSQTNKPKLWSYKYEHYRDTRTGKKLVSKDRAEKHGDKIVNHENIARLWSGYIQNKTN